MALLMYTDVLFNNNFYFHGYLFHKFCGEFFFRNTHIITTSLQDLETNCLGNKLLIYASIVNVLRG